MSTRSTGISRRGLMKAGGAAIWPALGGCTSPHAPSPDTLRLLVLGPPPQLVRLLDKKMLPAFRDSSGLDVELQTSDWGSAFQKVTTGAASNSLADVFMVGGIWTAALASKHVMLDITDRVKRWAGRAQLPAAGLADGMYRGRNYAVPVMMDVRTCVYRRDMLDAGGIGSSPSSWDELRRTAEKLKAKGVTRTPIFWGLDKSVGLQQAFAQLFLQAGGRYWDDAGNASFDSEAGHRALKFLADTFRHGLADANLVYSGNGPHPLVSGRCALTLGGWSIQHNAEANDPRVADDIAAGPALKPDADSLPQPVAWFDKLAIADNTMNADGAWHLLTFLAGAANEDGLARLSGSLPARRDLAARPWLTPMARQVLTSADRAISQPVNPVMMQLGPTVRTLLEPAIRGSASVTSTLRAIDRKVDDLHA